MDYAVSKTAGRRSGPESPSHQARESFQPKAGGQRGRCPSDFDAGEAAWMHDRLLRKFGV